jgi:histone-binding protein RBBP4
MMVVQDVQFCPSNAQGFCRVGDDSSLILWEARFGNELVIKVDKAHDVELRCAN